MRSRPITVAVSQRGIKLRELREGMLRTIKEAVMSNLSAVGSRKAPIFVFFLKSLAKKPSRMSVIPAKRKMRRVKKAFLLNTIKIKMGMRPILSSEMRLGRVSNVLLVFDFIQKNIV